jgi:hypothetical protein
MTRMPSAPWHTPSTPPTGADLYLAPFSCLERRLRALTSLQHVLMASGTLIVPPLWAGRTRRFIHPSAWNSYSRKFVCRIVHSPGPMRSENTP